MMGTRSGDVDPSVIPLLTHEEGMQIDEVMTLLNKKSGLLGVSGESLDTRVLMEQYDSNPRAKLAMDMFAYRARKAVGSLFAALGSAEQLSSAAESATPVRPTADLSRLAEPGTVPRKPKQIRLDLRYLQDHDTRAR